MSEEVAERAQEGREELLHTEPVIEAKVKVKAAQWCLTLCNPTGCTGHGILQARILEWVAISFSREYS